MDSPSSIDLPSVGKASKQADRVIQIVIDKNESLQLKADAGSVPARLRCPGARGLAGPPQIGVSFSRVQASTRGPPSASRARSGSRPQ